MPIEFHDRYSALGRKPPNPATMCRGQCEGLGFYPVPAPPDHPKWGGKVRCSLPVSEEERRLWYEAEKKHPTDDGWHFIVCPECKGTGLRVGKG